MNQRYNRKMAEEKIEDDAEFRKNLEEAAEDPEFKKFMEELDEKEKELLNHPYTKARDILDEDFELVISYPKNGVPNGTCEHQGKDEEIPIIESILIDENVEGALITNDLEIIEITPDINTVIFAETAKVNAVWVEKYAATQDYTIYEYIRKV